MQDAQARQSFSDIGGHTAIDFVNTMPMLSGKLHERLADYLDLLGWAQSVALVQPDEAARLRSRKCGEEASAALVEARVLREALRADLPGLSAGKAASTELVSLLNGALAMRAGTMALRRKDGRCELGFGGPVETPSHLVALIAYQIADLLSGPNLARIKRCDGAKCVLWFVDATRNGSRHWCRMDRCGARAKAAAYYARKKA